MKKYSLIPVMLLFSSLLFGQGIYNNGGKIVIGSGVTLTVSGSGGNYRNETGGLLNLSGSMKLGGNLTNNAAADVIGTAGAGSKVELNGTAAQTIGGTTSSTFTFPDLVVNNPTGVTFQKDASVTGALSLTNGLVDIGNNNFTLGAASTIVGTPSASSMIIATGTGQVQKAWTATGSFTFPVGDNTGTAEYSPVSLTFTSGTFGSGGFTGLTLTNSAYTDPLITGSYLNRYWNLTQTGITSPVYNATFQYVIADVVGTESSIRTFRVTPLPKTTFSLANTTLHQLIESGLTSFGTFTGGPAVVLAAYAVTGGGLYCFGSGGLPVGVANSELGVTYTLFKNAVAQVPTVLGTGSAISFGNQLAGTYTVVATNGTSTTNMTGSAVIIENPIPSITGTTPGSVCGSGTATLGAIASAGTINWYAASSGGLSLGSGISFITPAISTTTTYYVDANDNGCISAFRTAIIATVNPIPTITSTTPGSVCGSGTATLGATASAGTINWYAAASGGLSLGSGTTFITPGISGTTTYYAEAVSPAGCISAVRTAVTATVNPIPTITVTTPGSVCVSGTVTLGATASAGTINWYAAASGGLSLGLGTSFTTPVISATTTYYVDATNLGCTTALRSAVVATVDPISVGGTVASAQTICIGSSPADLTVSGNVGNVVKWQKSVDLAFSSPTDILVSSTTLSGVTIGSLISPTYFRAVIQSGICSTANSGSVLISIAAPGDWIGAISTDWNTASNWCGGIPTSTSDIVIHSGSANMPLLSAGGACRTITIDPTASLTIAGTGTLSIAGNLVNSGTITANTGSAIVMNGSSSQTILGGIVENFSNLAVNNASGVTLLSDVNVNNVLTLTSGTFSVADRTLTISGSSPIRTTGNIDASNALGSLNFANTSAITLPASIFSGPINNLTISGSGGVTAGGDITVNGILNLAAANPTATKGLLEMTISYASYPGTTNAAYLSSNILNMGANATTVGIGDVTGTVRRSTIVDSTPYTFGNQFTTVALTAGTMPSNISVSITIGATAPGKPNAVQRTYEIVPTGGSNCFVNANFHYLDTELTSSISPFFTNTEANMVTWDYDIGGGTATPDEHGRSDYDFTNNFVGMSNIPISYFINTVGHAWRTIFMVSDYQTAYYTWNGSSSSSWNTSTNWTPSGIPSFSSNVIIPDAATTPNDPVLPFAPITIINTMSIKAGGILVMGNNTLTINNTLSGGWEDQNPLGNDPGTSTVIFSRPGASISGSARFYNVQINTGADITNQTGSSMKIANLVTKVGTGKWYADVFGATIEYNGGNQTIIHPDGTPDYHHLILSGSGVKTLPASPLTTHGDLTVAGTATVNAGGALTIVGNLTLGSGTTFTAGSFSHTVGGNLTNNGATFSTAGSTFTLNGTGVQSIGGSVASTFNNLTLNNSAGATLGNSETINGTLALTSGILNLGANNLTLGSAAVAGAPSASNMIVTDGTGELRRTFSANGSFLFPVGDATGTAEYSPVTLNFTAGTYAGGAYAGVRVTNAKHPNNASITDYLNRYWSVTSSAISGFSCNLTGTYLPADISGTEGNQVAGQFNGSLPWVKYSVLSANTLTANGATSFSDFTGISGNAPTVTIAASPSLSVCPNTALTLTANPVGDTPFTYLWSPGGATTASINPSTAAVGSVLYTVVVTDGNGNTATNNATVVVNATPTLVITTPAAACSPATVDLTAPTVTAGSTASLTLTYWSDAAATIPYGTPTTTTAGSYYIKGTTSSGCFDIQPVTVTVNNCGNLLNVKVFLEGAYDATSGAMRTDLQPTIARPSQLIPLAHPYSGAPWNVAAAPASSIPAGVVDWVLVELRTATTPALALSGTIISGWPKAFFLKSDGSIVDLDGTSLPNIGNPTITGNLFVIVRHRNHLAIMSNTGATLLGGTYIYDFTSALTQAYGGGAGYKQITGTIPTYAMVVGDINHDGNVFVTDYNAWAVQFGATSTYSNSDLNQDGNVFVTDYNKWAVNFGNTTINPTLLKSADLKPWYISCVPK